MEYYSVIKKNEIIPPAATWIDLEMIIPSEVSQTEMNTIQYYLYVESKRWHKWTSTDQKHTRRQRTDL